MPLQLVQQRDDLRTSIKAMGGNQGLRTWSIDSAQQHGCLRAALHQLPGLPTPARCLPCYLLDQALHLA